MNNQRAEQAVSGSGSSPSELGTPVATVRGICKSYGHVQAVRAVSLELMPGEVHALIGENGSGKSTLVGILSGTVTPDSGTMTYHGVDYRPRRPSQAQAAGVMTVFQDGSILPELTVAQNLYLGTPATQRPSYREVERWARGCLEKIGLATIAADARAGTLAPGDRQLLEIARAVMSEPTLLLLDEATSALDAAGVDHALALAQDAAEAGTAVVLVTHRLGEVTRIADRVTVLRDGACEGTFEADAVTQDGLVTLMAGTSVDQEFPPRATAAEVGPSVLVARRLASAGFGPVDIVLRAGEIVGIAGADGNGQRELMRGLAAVGAPDGELELEGRRFFDYASAVASGILLLPGNRLKESLFAPLSIRENAIVGVLGKLSQFGIVSARKEREHSAAIVERFGIRLGSDTNPVTSLSGGNQQKLALGRALSGEPRVLIIDEPTQGVDVRSRADIYRELRKIARSGLAVVINCSDAAELAGLCDRILVVSRGKLVDDLRGAGTSEEAIVRSFATTEQDARDVAPSAAASRPVASSEARGSMRRWLTALRGRQAVSRTLVLMLGIALLGAYAQNQSPTFLTTPSIYNVMLLTVPLATVAAAQFAVLIIGGIDISVGATMGLTIAVMSFVVEQNMSLPVALVLAAVVALGIGVAVGAVNATLIEGARLSPVIATIATLGIVSGVGLLLRPTPAGVISTDLASALTSSVSAFPWVLIGLVVLFAAGDWMLYSTSFGLRLRSVGLNAPFAERLGIEARRLRCLCYLTCGVLAALAGVFLSAQVGIGDPTVGSGFTLLAIAAPVLGGASLLGGYGTLIGASLGALVLVMAETMPTILALNTAWSLVFTGAVTLVALIAYSGAAGPAMRAAARSRRQKILSLATAKARRVERGGSHG
jgi:ribose transport system ATP-binding protein